MEDESSLVRRASSLSNLIQERPVESLSPFEQQIEQLASDIQHISQCIKQGRLERSDPAISDDMRFSENASCRKMGKSKAFLQLNRKSSGG